MPVMPPDVSTSSTRMSRVSPSGFPLSQGSSAQGIRSIVRRMSRMVMSGLAVIGVSLLLIREIQAQMTAANPAVSTAWPTGDRSGAFGNLENETGRGGVREQAAL